MAITGTKQAEHRESIGRVICMFRERHIYIHAITMYGARGNTAKILII